MLSEMLAEQARISPEERAVTDAFEAAEEERVAEMRAALAEQERMIARENELRAFAEEAQAEAQAHADAEAARQSQEAAQAMWARDQHLVNTVVGDVLGSEGYVEVREEIARPQRRAGLILGLVLAALALATGALLWALSLPAVEDTILPPAPAGVIAVDPALEIGRAHV